MENTITHLTNEKKTTLLDLKSYTSLVLTLKLGDHVPRRRALMLHGRAVAERFPYSWSSMLDGILKAEIRFSALIISLWVPSSIWVSFTLFLLYYL